MLIGGSSTPFYQSELTSYTTLAPDLTPYGGITGGGGVGTYFTGYGAGLPYSPFGNAQTGVAMLPITTPAATAPLVGGGDQVAYAHYAPAGTGTTTTTTIPTATTAPTSAPAVTDPKKAEETKKSVATKKKSPTVTVRSGDSLSKIAAAAGTTWQKLYALNKGAIGSDPNLIRPGLKLKLP